MFNILPNEVSAPTFDMIPIMESVSAESTTTWRIIPPEEENLLSSTGLPEENPTSWLENAICQCGKKAKWLYMPAGGENPFACEECVPRGCHCQDSYIGPDFDPHNQLEVVANYNNPRYWITGLDEQGRALPCVEWEEL